MKEILATVPVDVGLFVLLGVVLGFMIKGLGTRRRIQAALAEGAIVARTSITGDGSLEARIDELVRERDRLKQRVEALIARSDNRRKTQGSGRMAVAAKTDGAPDRPRPKIEAVPARPEDAVAPTLRLQKPATRLRRPALAMALDDLRARTDRADCDGPDDGSARQEASDALRPTMTELPATAPEADELGTETLLLVNPDFEDRDTSRAVGPTDESDRETPRPLFLRHRQSQKTASVPDQTTATDERHCPFSGSPRDHQLEVSQ